MIDTCLAEILFADPTGLLRAFLYAVPAMLFVVDKDVAILECNAAAARVLDVESQDQVHALAGDVHALHSCGAGAGRVRSHHPLPRLHPPQIGWGGVSRPRRCPAARSGLKTRS